MRPLTTVSDSIAAQRSGEPRSSPELMSPTTSSTNPVTCFLTTESQLQESSITDETSQRLIPRYRNGPHKYSLEAIRQHVHSRAVSPARTTDSISLSSYNSTDQHSLLESSRPITPGLAGTSGAVSAISSTSSRRQSLTTSSIDIDDSALASLVDLGFAETPAAATNTAVPDVSSQLIMPSLAVPTRRPFTETGRSLGKLKILVAGAEGSGKTTLIETISRICRHIVYVDQPIKTRRCAIHKIYASSRPRLWWRTQEDWPIVPTPGRSKSSSEDVLDRNICFVDADAVGDAAHGTPRSARNTIVPYVKTELSALLKKPLEDADLQALVSIGDPSVVDVAFYLLKDTADDAQFQEMKELSSMTNVIPLIARSDETSAADLLEAKQRIHEQLTSRGVDFFRFSDSSSAADGTLVYAVSNATVSDHENWDASALMDSQYVRPLVHTDLELLVERVFSICGCSWLRHSVARKVIEYRSLAVGFSSRTLTRRQDRQDTLSPVRTANPFDRRQYWEQVLASDWARGLRQSLEAEREATMSLLAQADPSLAVVKKYQEPRRLSRMRCREVLVNEPQQDPLGLLGLVSQAKQGGKLTLELFSGVGAVGALAAVILRSEYASRGLFSGFSDCQILG